MSPAGSPREPPRRAPPRPRPGGWARQATSSLLLVAAVVAACAAFALLGGIVLPGLGGLVAWIGLGFLLFVAAQMLLFRAFGLSSHADEPEPEDSAPEAGPGDPRPAPEDEDGDWRAWRG